LMRGVNAPPEDAEVPDVPPFLAAPKGWVAPTGVPAPPIGDAELFPIMPTCTAAPTDVLASSAADNAVARTVRDVFIIFNSPYLCESNATSKDTRLRKES
jgi:hypothetical protein